MKSAAQISNSSISARVSPSWIKTITPIAARTLATRVLVVAAAATLLLAHRRRVVAHEAVAHRHHHAAAAAVSAHHAAAAQSVTATSKPFFLAPTARLPPRVSTAATAQIMTVTPFDAMAAHSGVARTDPLRSLGLARTARPLLPEATMAFNGTVVDTTALRASAAAVSVTGTARRTAVAAQSAVEMVVVAIVHPARSRYAMTVTPDVVATAATVHRAARIML